jgi:hypothetical protein
MMAASPSFVGLCFVDEIGDAWFSGSGVEVPHRALSYHCPCLAVGRRSES